jgi:chromosome segregation ATPase
MISGLQALREIENAANQARGQEGQLDGALRSASDELARLRAERAALLRQYAQVRLDLIQREGLVNQLDAAERRALDLINQTRAALDQLTARQADVQARHLQAETDRHARADEVTKLLSSLEELQARVEPQVRSSPAWIGQKGTVDRSESVWTAADKKAEQAETDREAKGKPYEADPLFSYLWKRGYGTAKYRASYFVQYIDGKVASLVGFQGARANYAMLNEIPARLREHADRCRADLDAERGKLTAIEHEGLKQAGSEAIEAKLVAARATLDEADHRLEEADATMKALDQERSKLLVTGENSNYQRAIDILAEADSHQDLQSLRRSAAQTRSDADDAIVTQIEKADARAAAVEQQVAELRAKALDLARRRAEIESQRETFRRRGYDNPMGQFSNEQAIGNVLGGILQGVVQGAVLGQVLQGGYNQRAPRADGGFGGQGGFTFPSAGGGGGMRQPPGEWINRGDPGGNWGPDPGSFGGDDTFRTGGTF